MLIFILKCFCFIKKILIYLHGFWGIFCSRENYMKLMLTEKNLN